MNLRFLDGELVHERPNILGLHLDGIGPQWFIRAASTTIIQGHYDAVIHEPGMKKPKERMIDTKPGDGYHGFTIAG